MPLKHLHSDTPGARANLIPGQIGHNRADDVLLLRGDLKKLEVDLDGLRHRAPPKDAPRDAVLVRQGSGVAWDAGLIPSSVVDGVIAVDAPPPVYGVPGFMPAEPGQTFIFSSNVVLIEPFYVASDQITLTKLAVKFTEALSGTMRLGIASVDPNAVLLDLTVASGANGLHEEACSLVLPRGRYVALAWVQTSAQLQAVAGYRYNQGYSLDGNGAPLFLRRQLANSDLTAGLDSAGLPVTDLLTGAPGEDKSILMKWTL